MSKTERNGVIVLIVLILVVIMIRFFVADWFADRTDYSKAIEEKIEKIENQRNTEIVYEKNNERNKAQKGYSFSTNKISTTKSEPDREVKYFKFDPNTATYNDLIKLGFPPKLANTLINYREKGGRFKKSVEILKLYNIDSSLFLKIEPYIEIAHEQENVERKENFIQRIEINTADSILFTQIKGVGPVLASRICKYRNALGGFTSIDQISEVYKFPLETFQQIKDQLMVDTQKVDKININFAELNELKKHPYCNYALARRIVDYRSKKGCLKSIEQLQNDSVLSTNEYEKLHAYLSVK